MRYASTVVVSPRATILSFGKKDLIRVIFSSFTPKRSRGSITTQQDLLKIVNENCSLSSDEKKRLEQLRPNNYVGLAKELALSFVKTISKDN